MIRFYAMLLVFMLSGFFTALPIQAYEGEIIARSDYTLYVNGHRVYLDAPVVETGGVLYVCVRDLKSPLQFDMELLERDNFYRLSMPNRKTCNIVPNSPEIWVNSTKHFLNAPVIQYENKIYVPIDSFSRIVGFTWSSNHQRPKAGAKKVTSSNNKTVIYPAGHSQAKKKFFWPWERRETDPKHVRGGAVRHREPQYIQDTGIPLSSQPLVRPRVIPAEKGGGPTDLGTDQMLVHSEASAIAQATVPQIDTRDSFNMVIDGKKVDMTGRFLYINDRMYLDMSDFLRSVGFRVVRAGNAVTVTRAGRQHVLTIGSNQIVVTKGKRSFSHYVMSPILERQGKVYFSYDIMPNVFGYYNFWEPSTRSLHMLNPIMRLDFKQSKEKGYYLEVGSVFEVKYEAPKRLENPRRIVITFPYSYMALDENTFSPNLPPFSEMRFRQKSDLSSELEIELTDKVAHRLETGRRDFAMRFIPVITDIEQTIEGGQPHVKIVSTLPTVFKPWKMQDPWRMILDCEPAVSELDSTIPAAQNKVYTQISTAQLALDPPKTRITLTLTGSPEYTISRPDRRSIEFIFGKTDKTARPETAIVSQAASAAQPVLNAAYPVSGKTIVLDPGHGGNDPGAMGPNSLMEKEINLDIALRLKMRLERAGARVLMARVGDGNPTLQYRADFANQNRAHAFVSIHINSFIVPFVDGVRTYYYDGTYNERFAKVMQRAMVAEIKREDKGIHKNRFAVLRMARQDMPSVLLEPCYISNPVERDLLNKPEFRQKIAEGAYQGLRNWFGTKH